MCRLTTKNTISEMGIKILVLCGGLFLMGPLMDARADAQEANILRQSEIWDELKSKVPVSTSGVVRGLQIADYTFGVDDLFLCLPKHKVDELILEITSIDGRYKAKAKFDLRGRDPGVYRLALELGEQEKRFLRDQKPEHLSYLAYLPTQAGRQTIGKLLPVRGEAKAEGGLAYELKLHSKATKTTVEWTEDGRSESAQCHRIQRQGAGAPAHRSFNTTCTFRPEVAGDFLEAYLIRQRFRDYLPRIEMTIGACR